VIKVWTLWGNAGDLPPTLVFSPERSLTLSFLKTQQGAQNHQREPKAKLAFSYLCIYTSTTELNNCKKIHVLTKKASALGNFNPQTLHRGFAAGSHWGTSVPHFPILRLLT